VAALAIPYLFLLSASGLLGPDEPRYAAIGHEMARSGDWITPRLWGAAWFEKPPLLYWLVASFDKLGFAPDLAARLPVTLLGLGLLLVLPNLESAMILGTAIGWLALSQVGITDVPLSFCFFLYLHFTVKGQPWRAGIAMGAAMLAKGLVPVALALPVAWLYRRHWQSAVAALLIALPWYALCYAANGQAFVDEFLIRHHISRFFTPELQHVQPFWFYVPVLLGLLLPWAPALRHLRWQEELKAYLYTVAWGFLFLSASRNKLPAYVLPLLPPLAVLLAPAIRRWHYGFAAALYVALPAVTPWLPVAIDKGLSKADLTTTAWAWLAAMPLAFGLAWRWGVPALILTVVLSVLTLKASLYPVLAAKVSARESKLTCLPPGASRGLRYGLSYYRNREIDYCLEPEEDVAPLQGPDKAPRDQEVKRGDEDNPVKR
jgi:4-amino-4-deoxy-L-arabinose transferase-like glycosyltransferase